MKKNFKSAFLFKNKNIATFFGFQVVDALLAYNEGTTPDFLLVELHDGRLRVSVNDGSGNTTWRGFVYFIYLTYHSIKNSIKWHEGQVRANQFHLHVVT